MLVDLSHDDHFLECRGISLMSTVSQGPWYSKIYNPPLVAQFLKEISLEAQAGEVHGVVGVAGSGKTTLLEVIAARAAGDIGGTVLLDKHLLTDSRFNRLCSFVDFRVRYPPFMTVRSLMYYQARLVMGTGKQKDIEERVRVHIIQRHEDMFSNILVLMQEWELLGYGHERIGDLSESARRRAIMAMNMIKDPILVVVDDPIRNLEPLSSYQLMLCLQSYMKRHNRIAVVSMRSARSDIYQLLSRISILFYGELFYTGLTKKLPSYFRQVGFTCPATENPATYYISLGTVDRETTDRYLETQEQAMKLVEQFKIRSNSLLTEMRPRRDAYGMGSTVALCYQDKPSTVGKFGTLLRRSFMTIYGRPMATLAHLAILPLSTIFLSLFFAQLTSPSKSLPYSVVAQLTILSLHVATISTVVTLRSFSPLRVLYSIECSSRLYNGVLPVISFIITSIFLDAGSVFLTTISYLWFTSSKFANLLPLFVALFSSFLCAKLQTICWMMIIRRQFNVFMFQFVTNSLQAMYSGGFWKSYTTMNQLGNWMNLPTFLSSFRYVNHALFSLFISNVTTNCTRNEHTEIDNSTPDKFCRWSSGRDLLTETYPSTFQPSDSWSNIGLSYFVVLISLFFVLLLYAAPKPKALHEKFKFN